MTETELKPCPFCGGEAAFLSETATIKCKKCGRTFIVTNPLISRLEAVVGWNRWATQYTKFRPNCGAKMKGGAE